MNMRNVKNIDQIELNFNVHEEIHWEYLVIFLAFVCNFHAVTFKYVQLCVCSHSK